MTNVRLNWRRKRSREPGTYQLNGYNPATEYVSDYINRMGEPMQFQKVYRAEDSYVDDESSLYLAELTNMRHRNQVFHPSVCGILLWTVGMPSLDKKDLESALQQGLLTNLEQSACESYRGKSFYRYNDLPEFGNPQRLQHIQEPPVAVGGWIRGGSATRDYVRRVDYKRRCMNQMNMGMIYKD